jgi:6-pyruvoyltetrahydropterin/6-carboxytetrahydropterin synthase
VKGEELDKDGLLIDFSILKDRTKEIIERFDHKFLNDLECFSEINPSSENITKYIYEELEKGINNNKIKVSRITAWESDTACATYWAG